MIDKCSPGNCERWPLHKYFSFEKPNQPISSKLKLLLERVIKTYTTNDDHSTGRISLKKQNKKEIKRKAFGIQTVAPPQTSFSTGEHKSHRG